MKTQKKEESKLKWGPGEMEGGKNKAIRLGELLRYWQCPSVDLSKKSPAGNFRQIWKQNSSLTQQKLTVSYIFVLLKNPSHLTDHRKADENLATCICVLWGSQTGLSLCLILRNIQPILTKSKKARMVFRSWTQNWKVQFQIPATMKLPRWPWANHYLSVSPTEHSSVVTSS